MRLSIVIPTFDGARTIADQLDALCGQDQSDLVEVVVSDNGSSDDTLAIVAGYADRLPGLRTVDSSDVRGVSHARNVGARVATGDSLLFCDQDDVVGEGWLAAMAAALAVSPVVAARLEHDRLNPSWTQPQHGRPQETGLADAHSPFPALRMGLTIGVRRELHVSVGGFDESFREGREDNDYCYRLQLRGEQLHFAPTAVVHYRHRRRLRDIFRQSRGYGRETVRLLAKYRQHSMGRPSQLRAGFSWLRLILGVVVELPTRPGRTLWFSRAGRRVGKLEASLELHVLAL